MTVVTALNFILLAVVVGLYIFEVIVRNKHKTLRKRIKKAETYVITALLVLWLTNIVFSIPTAIELIDSGKTENAVAVEEPTSKLEELNYSEIGGELKLDISNIEELEEITYKDFLDKAEAEKIDTLYYTETDMTMYVLTVDKEIYTCPNPDYESFRKEMLEMGLKVKPVTSIWTSDDAKEAQAGRWAIAIIVAMMVLTLFICLTKYKMKTTPKLGILVSMISNDGSQLKGVGSFEDTNLKKDKDKANGENNVKHFDDIAGLKEVKKDMACLVDFLKNKGAYIAAGAKLPKGVILYGPPGTGKTLLAKAVAGEAGIPFLYMSGSDFIEMYVGVGAKRVRELFKEARKKAPCIVFIDEIDAIGSARQGSGDNGEDRKTINALLTEMDGFNESSNILVIGATNRIEDLDPALLRPGRFTNKYCVPLPETSERLEVIKLYAKNKNFSEDVDFEALAKETIGFSPAQIESLLNEAAIIQVQEKKAFINLEVMEKAMFKMLLSGHAKENQNDRDKAELELVAWHEAGHALMGKLNGKEVNKVTILASTSGAGGVTFVTPAKEHLLSVKDLKDEVRELYAGRVAEYLLYNDESLVTTGASNDMERATSIIQKIVTKFGMTDEYGLLNLEVLRVKSDVVIEKEVELSEQLKKETTEILKENYETLKRIAESLMEKETLYAKDLDELIGVKINETEPWMEPVQ